MPPKRLLLKVSGEMLLGDQPFGINDKACRSLAQVCHEVVNSGHELAVVIGGGNIFRGMNLNELGMERTPADQIGMLATLMNGVALQQAAESLRIKSHLISAVDCPKIAESYNWHKAINYLEKGHLVIFVGGTGSPYFTTDTAAALRASEMKVDILLKATKVPGVFSEDPLKNKQSTRFSQLSYTDYLSKKLGVMDATAVALCMSSHVPIFVFSMAELGTLSISRLLTEREKYGTLIG